MTEQAKPGDLLHRYVLRKGLVKKVQGRVRSSIRFGTRNPLGDVQHVLLDPPKVVFDVGANIGYVAHDFHRAWPEAQLHAFEPTPETFASLQGNIGGLPNVTCVRSAVSDADGTAVFNVDNQTHRGGSNSLLGHSEEFDALVARSDRFVSVEVPTLRLDTYCSEQGIGHVDVCKLDIEGAEPMALRGASGLLEASAIDVIITEVRLVRGHEGGPLLHELIEQLDEHDYRPFGIYNFAESQLGQSMWGDAVFLGPAFRRRLIERHGQRYCGFVD